MAVETHIENHQPLGNLGEAFPGGMVIEECPVKCKATSHKQGLK